MLCPLLWAQLASIGIRGVLCVERWPQWPTLSQFAGKEDNGT